MSSPHAHSTKRQCSRYAVGFWGYLRGAYFTSQFWQHYLLNTARIPQMDAFWHGPNQVFENPPPGKSPEDIAVTESLLYSMLGASLRGFGTHEANMRSFQDFVAKQNIPDEFILKLPNGADYFHQKASRSLSAITNIAHVVQLVTNYAHTHCERNYTHVLLTRMDLLLYGYPSFPISPQNMVLYSEGNEFSSHDPGQLRRRFSLAPQFDGLKHQMDLSLPHFNDQMIWVPWEVFTKMATANSQAVQWWKERSVSPNMETSLYQLFKHLGAAQQILPYDFVPFTIYRGPGERPPYEPPQVPYAHQNFIESRSQGWIDHADPPRCPKSGGKWY
jgi:hypothetical protein